MASIKVPPLGESIVEATVSRWLKQVGDAVSTGDTLVELETDKITVEVAAQESGVLSTLSVKEGDVVNVGDSLGEIGAGGGQASGGQSSGGKVSDAQHSGAPSAPKAEQPPQREPVSAASGGLGGGSATASGTGKEGGAREAFVAAPSDAAQGGAPIAHGGADGVNDAGGVKVSPAASRIAAESGLDIGRVVGTGRGGVVSKPDVLGALNAQSSIPTSAVPAMQSERPKSESATAPAAPKESSASSPSAASSSASASKSPQRAPDAERETREKMSTRRKRIAENLLQSQHMTAHLTTFNEIDMTEIMSLRGRLKDRLEKEKGVKLSFMPFFTKAACLALKAYPLVNSQLDGDHI
ncbi:MAG: 2-oxo acid dehydrogenase subunit E2, partial [Gemmatimonadaceae bacterium]